MADARRRRRRRPGSDVRRHRRLASPPGDAAGGLAITTTPVGEADVLIVPGFELTQRLDLAPTLSSLAIEVETIRRLQSEGVAIVSICVGAFLLGEAGLLDGRDSTTSWLFADELARRHPSTRVHPERLVVTDRGITTTAAFSAMYDFALGLVREHHGPDIARATARIALVDDARSAQTPYVEVDLLPTTGAGFSRSVQRWLDQQLGDRYDLAVVSRAFNMSTRTMLRRFGDETGESPLSYLQRSRIRRARHCSNRPTGASAASPHRSATTTPARSPVSSHVTWGGPRGTTASRSSAPRPERHAAAKKAHQQSPRTLTAVSGTPRPGGVAHLPQPAERCGPTSWGNHTAGCSRPGGHSCRLLGAG